MAGEFLDINGLERVAQKVNASTAAVAAMASDMSRMASDVADVNTRADNMESFIENTFDLQRRVSELEKFGTAPFEKTVSSAHFESGVLKENFLPVHETYQFCRKFALRYSADFVGTQSPELIKVNGKPVGFSEPIGIGESSEDVRNIDVMADINPNTHAIEISVYKDDVLVETLEIEDSFVLTVEVETSGANPTFGSLKGTYFKMKYLDISLDYPYPVFELRDGMVVYMDEAPGKAMCGTWDMLACYNLGNLTTQLYCTGNYSDATLSTSLSYAAKNEYVPSGHKGCEYIYMANWQWLANVPSATALWCYHHCASDLNVFNQNIPIVKELDFSKICLHSSTQLGFPNITYGYTGEVIATDIMEMLDFNTIARTAQIRLASPYVKNYGTNVYKMPIDKISKVEFKNSRCLETLGDLSEWDVTKLSTLETMFSNCYSLKYVGDIGKWGDKGTFATSKVSNMFKSAINLRGISDKIKNWRFPNATSLAWMFENTMNIGDETIHGLGEWEVGQITDMRGVFCYYVEDAVNEEIRRFYVVERHLPMPEIVVPKTDLSFVENWNMGSVTRLRGFFANNPYLVNVGDLRKWNIPNLETGVDGITKFIMGCSALVDFKMPSVPRGVDVTDFAAGCSKLANIEVDALNVEAISFEDCPLTKQSVLNLINAATDDVEITLKESVYQAVASDAAVVSAIGAKANAGVTVQLLSA